jgi:hypothetical protein
LAGFDYDCEWMNGQSRTLLVVGDIVTLVVVTVFGFATHGTLGSAGARILATFVPLLIAWAAVAPFLGVYDLEQARDPRRLWRPLWAMVLAAPLASWLRGVMLGAPILPTFVLVIGGVSALGILAWRSLYALIARNTVWNPKN